MIENNITDCGHYSNQQSWFGLSWTAVFAGAFASIGLSILMNLLNLGLGLSTFGAGANPTTLAFMTFIWTSFTVFLIMGTAGLITGCLARRNNFSCYSGVIHGLVGWCVGLVIMLVLASQLTLAIPVNLHTLAVVTSNSATLATDVNSN